MEQKTTGDNIKDLRLRLGFSQDELAEISGLSLRSIQRIENNKTIGRGDSLQRISKALNVNIQELTTTAEVTFPSLSKNLIEDRKIPVLLIMSAFGYFFHPVLGVVLPTLVWLLFRNKIESVEEVGVSTIRLELIWLAIIAFGYMYIFSKKFLILTCQFQTTINSSLFLYPLFMC